MLYYSPHDISWPDWQLSECNRVDYATALAQPFRVAALMANYDTYSTWNMRELQGLDWSVFDLVLLSAIEPCRINDIKVWATKTGIKNYKLLVGGYEFNAELDSNTLYRPWWAFNIVNSNPVDEFVIVQKPYYFDALLGGRTPARDFVMHAMQQHKLLDQNIVTYRDVFGANNGPQSRTERRISEYFQPQQLTWPYVSPNLKSEWEVQSSITPNISSMVPHQIYNHTYYSIICETDVRYNDLFCLTEKTGKALYGHRLFVHFGVPGFMAELGRLGFETFGSVIDESYDHIPDPIDRFQAAFDQVIALSKQDPIKILNQIKPVLIHNHNQLRRWLLKSREEIKQLVLEA